MASFSKCGYLREIGQITLKCLKSNKLAKKKVKLVKELDWLNPKNDKQVKPKDKKPEGENAVDEFYCQ